MKKINVPSSTTAWGQADSPSPMSGESNYMKGSQDWADPSASSIEKQESWMDTEALKERIKQNQDSEEHQYDVAEFYKKTGIWQYIARHQVFETLTLVVISTNALWMAVDTDLNGAAVLLQAHPVFQIAEHLFCLYFTFEWTVRFMSFKRKCNGLRDYWFIFDSILVCMMVLETWVMSIVLLATGTAGGGGMGNASLLRMARLLRLSRMARMARLFRALPELLILIKGMASAMKSVFFTLCLMTILVYVFAIGFRQLTDGTTVGFDYFSSVPASMHTLLLDGSLMDNPGVLIFRLSDESVVLAAFFYIFILFAALTLCNMLIGVLCEVVSNVAHIERHNLTVSFVREKLMEVVHQLNPEEDIADHRITKQEFEEMLGTKEANLALNEVGVDAPGLVDIIDFLFQDGKVFTFDEFMDSMVKLRGSNTATVKDVVELRRFLVVQQKELKEDLLDMLGLVDKRATFIKVMQGKKHSASFGKNKGMEDALRAHGCGSNDSSFASVDIADHGPGHHHSDRSSTATNGAASFLQNRAALVDSLVNANNALLGFVEVLGPQQHPPAVEAGGSAGGEPCQFSDGQRRAGKPSMPPAEIKELTGQLNDLQKAMMESLVGLQNCRERVCAVESAPGSRQNP
mmetsp:Transcript_66191/g.186386  ORF Transcript_66191/g.186386 Transcript_66191/m.186386 type:complete len:631 (-) Transcript_66191:241-2133(-)